MGSESLFDGLEPEDRVEIVDFASEIYKTNKRAPRIAVNASSWWYKNLSRATVKNIRDKVRGQPITPNPAERNIFFYALHILELGFELHLVFDGPRFTKDVASRLHPSHDPPSPLLRELLTSISVSWHDAPSSADAECVKMEAEGIVDAVWSDSDHGEAFAFGCQTLIRSSRKVSVSTEQGEAKKKDIAKFWLCRADDIKIRFPGMDREGFVWYNVLKTWGHEGGSVAALETKDILKSAECGFGKSLCEASNSAQQRMDWVKTNLAEFLTESALEIPSKFPKWPDVHEFLTPTVSSRERLSSLPPRKDPFLDEHKLFSLLSDQIQFTITQWVKYMLPYRIVRSLLLTAKGAESQHDHLKLECPDITKKKSPKSAEATFLISATTSLNVLDIEPTREKLKTMLWVLRKANYNEQPSIKTFFGTPHSNQVGRAIPSSSATRRPRERLIPANGTALPPPASGASGEGPSGTNTGAPNDNPPPTPTPASRKRKRKLPYQASKKVSKVSKVTREPLTSTQESRKGKERENLTPPSSNTNQAASPNDDCLFVGERRRDMLPPSLTPPDTLERADAPEYFNLVDDLVVRQPQRAGS